MVNIEKQSSGFQDKYKYRLIFFSQQILSVAPGKLKKRPLKNFTAESPL